MCWELIGEIERFAVLMMLMVFCFIFYYLLFCPLFYLPRLIDTAPGINIPSCPSIFSPELAKPWRSWRCTAGRGEERGRGGNGLAGGGIRRETVRGS